MKQISSATITINNVAAIALDHKKTDLVNGVLQRREFPTLLLAQAEQAEVHLIFDDGTEHVVTIEAPELQLRAPGCIVKDGDGNTVEDNGPQ